MPEEGIVQRDAGISKLFVMMIEGNVEKSTRSEPLLNAELVINLKGRQVLKLLFNVFS